MAFEVLCWILAAVAFTYLVLIVLAIRRVRKLMKNDDAS